MTGEEVMQGADLMNRWRSLHKLKARLRNADLAGIATVLRDEEEIAGVAREAALDVAYAKLDGLIQSVHAEAVSLGISAPFPQH